MHTLKFDSSSFNRSFEITKYCCIGENLNQILKLIDLRNTIISNELTVPVSTFLGLICKKTHVRSTLISLVQNVHTTLTYAFFEHDRLQQNMSGGAVKHSAILPS